MENQHQSPRAFLQQHAKQEVAEAGKDRNQNGPCRVVVLHHSLLIHRCIDCVFIRKGSGGELMSEAAFPPLLLFLYRAAGAQGGCRGRCSERLKHGKLRERHHNRCISNQPPVCALINLTSLTLQKSAEIDTTGRNSRVRFEGGFFHL